MCLVTHSGLGVLIYHADVRTDVQSTGTQYGRCVVDLDTDLLLNLHAASRQ